MLEWNWISNICKACLQVDDYLITFGLIESAALFSKSVARFPFIKINFFEIDCKDKGFLNESVSDFHQSCTNFCERVGVK